MAGGRPPGSYGVRSRRAESVFLDADFDPLREKIAFAKRLRDEGSDPVLYERCLGDLIKYIYPQLRAIEIDANGALTFEELANQRFEEELAERFRKELEAEVKKQGLDINAMRAKSDAWYAKLSRAEKAEVDRMKNRPTSELIMELAEKAGIDLGLPIKD